ncbi:unnamed protein product [Cylicostephanus goldi]|uniref:Uncharacterized protein n=1 Tax=Cylicostephanus goldi TaxID=71465 RepID=A0A3P7MRB6_CYLGO|nr:unnamed protein product [Cylicostephanus goldi]
MATISSTSLEEMFAQLMQQNAVLMKANQGLLQRLEHPAAPATLADFSALSSRLPCFTYDPDSGCIFD